ncbi:hypothetical protein JKP88DRAFT_274700 [Tribonema minus]|uniref:Uncharacterized protein n=1 Tax=Tribonema minus TaxID=303371 RepID=A0A835ZIE7_9STRA|nr:hypothetical protein JKP88DRAFT_274700 [Tribonema minus]
MTLLRWYSMEVGPTEAAVYFKPLPSPQAVFGKKGGLVQGFKSKRVDKVFAAHTKKGDVPGNFRLVVRLVADDKQATDHSSSMQVVFDIFNAFFHGSAMEHTKTFNPRFTYLGDDNGDHKLIKHYMNRVAFYDIDNPPEFMPPPAAKPAASGSGSVSGSAKKAKAAATGLPADSPAYQCDASPDKQRTPAPARAAASATKSYEEPGDDPAPSTSESDVAPSDPDASDSDDDDEGGGGGGDDSGDKGCKPLSRSALAALRRSSNTEGGAAASGSAAPSDSGELSDLGHVPAAAAATPPGAASAAAPAAAAPAAAAPAAAAPVAAAAPAAAAAAAVPVPATRTPVSEYTKQILELKRKRGVSFAEAKSMFLELLELQRDLGCSEEEALEIYEDMQAEGGGKRAKN